VQIIETIIIKTYLGIKLIFYIVYVPKIIQNLLSII